jgi:hypothetical protein
MVNPVLKLYGVGGSAFKISLPPGPFFILLQMWVMYSQIGEGEGEPLTAARKGVR